MISSKIFLFINFLANIFKIFTSMIQIIIIINHKSYSGLDYYFSSNDKVDYNDTG